MAKSERAKMNNAIKNSMKDLAMERRAKVTEGCIYKKEDKYFWCIEDAAYQTDKRLITIGIKPWHYDETVRMIAYPEKSDTDRISDKMRWDGVFVAPTYTIHTAIYTYPKEAGANFIDYDKIPNMCKRMYDESVACLDNFLKMVKSQYKSLDAFYIANGTKNPLMAAIACIECLDYAKADSFLSLAKEINISFNWCFGSLDRDLRDVLQDYCNVMLQGRKWTQELVSGKK